MKNDEMNVTKKEKSKILLFKFFNKWFILGLIIILVSCIISLYWNSISQDDFIEFLRKLLPSVLQSIGIAFLIGAVFDFSKNTQGFIEFVSSLLSDVVVSKTFLSKLNEKEKSEALELILQPTENQVEQFSRIYDYFNKVINDITRMWRTNFKTNTVLNVTASKNSENGNVEITGILSYRIYKVKNKYEKIITKFEREGSNISMTRIIHPGGILPIETKKPTNKNIAGINYIEYEFEIPDNLYKYQYLTIERNIYEPGYDHWTNFHWTSLTPYDGLVFNLICKDNLSVKEHIIFDEKSLYNITFNDEKTEMNIISIDWLKANTGFSVTISEQKLFDNNKNGNDVKKEN